jgi:hypothetical protein
MFSVSIRLSHRLSKSSCDLTSVVWAQELYAAIDKANSTVDKLKVEVDSTDAAHIASNLQNIGQQLRAALRSVWIGDDGLFEIR